MLKENPRARKLYKRLGFAVTGETETSHRMRTADIPRSQACFAARAWRYQVRISSMHAMKEYYDRRAPEYHDYWYLGTGLYADCHRPGWNEELWELERVVAGLPPARTLDVACGKGFLTRFLRGEVVGLDQSERMVEIAS